MRRNSKAKDRYSKCMKKMLANTYKESDRRINEEFIKDINNAFDIENEMIRN